MTDFSSQSLNNTWGLPIQSAPKEVKLKVLSNLNLMRFTGNVIDTYINAMGDVAEGFLATICNNDDISLLDEETEDADEPDSFID